MYIEGGGSNSITPPRGGLLLLIVMPILSLCVAVHAFGGSDIKRMELAPRVAVGGTLLQPHRRHEKVFVIQPKLNYSGTAVAAKNTAEPHRMKLEISDALKSAKCREGWRGRGPLQSSLTRGHWSLAVSLEMVPKKYKHPSELEFGSWSHLPTSCGTK